MHLNDEIGLSPMARERKKWDLTQREGGMRPDTFQEYPKMLYRAIEDGNQIILDDPQHCRVIAHSADHEARLVRDGWCHSVPEAREAAEKAQEAIAEAAAERVFAEQRMSEMAQREAAAIDAAGAGRHVPEIPEAPRKRGRPSKADLAARQAS